ncbi:MAG: phenylacetate--CoA ligase, partial [Actinomycetia bacterium]|nr:phenylacetate--CoA ligase [Actinomycetes bacterium]
QIFIDRAGSLDQVRVEVEVSGKLFSDEIKKLEGLKRTIKEEIGSNLGISVEVKLVEPKTIARSEGKAKRVFDLRKE